MYRFLLFNSIAKFFTCIHFSGKIVELPFGDNPFATTTTPSPSVLEEKAPATAPAIPKGGPTFSAIPKAPPLNNQMQKKRTVQVINDSGRGEAHKKGKSTANDTPYAASLIIGDLAKENFKDEDVICWSKRGKVEAEFCLKQALGEAFFHGQDSVNSLESENLKLQQSLTNSKASSDNYKGMINGAE